MKDLLKTLVSFKKSDKKIQKTLVSASENNPQERKGLRLTNKQGLCNYNERNHQKTLEKHPDWNCRNLCKTRFEKSSLWKFTIYVVLAGLEIVTDISIATTCRCKLNAECLQKKYNKWTVFQSKSLIWYLFEDFRQRKEQKLYNWLFC